MKRLADIRRIICGHAVAGLCTAVIGLLAGCTSAQLPGSLSVWIVDGGRELSADTPPLLDNEVYSVSRGGASVRAAQNETVGLQIGLHTNSPPAGPYSIQVSDLTGPSAKIEAARDIRLFRVHDVLVERFRSWYPEHTGRPATPISVPDILVPWNAPRGGGPLRLDDGRSRAVWLDIHVPPDTPPGEYSGRIELYAEGLGSSLGSKPRTPAFSTELHVSVLPVVASAEQGLTAVARVDPRELLAAHQNWPIDLAEETRILPDIAGHQAARQLVQNTMAMLHDHGLTPVLWASFPKYKMAGERAVEIDWEAYDALVSGWIDGDAYADHVPAAVWPLPLSAAYPDAVRNGGFASPRYARVLAAYLAECRKHFEERGWTERAVLRITPPGPLSPDAVEQARRFSGIVKQSGSPAPLLWHLPAGSLRALGWFNAPPVDVPDTAVWCPPASWWTPDAMSRERGLGKRTWFLPDVPPYSASLAPEAPASDARCLAWQAFRYEADGVWLEGAANVGNKRQESVSAGTASELSGAALVYSGADYGIVDAPVPSIRLKRLRAGLLDAALLKKLGDQGQGLLAQRTAEQLVRWAFTDAADTNLVTARGAGWTADPAAYGLARELLLQELTGAGDSPAEGEAAGRSVRADWSRLTDQSARALVEVRGARLELTGDRLSARLFTRVSNQGGQALDGRWMLPQAPPGWALSTDASFAVASGASRSGMLELEMSSLAYNASGVLTLPLALESDAGAFGAMARLAVAAAPLVERPPTIDGDLSDWLVAPNNVATDFQLVRGNDTAIRNQSAPRGPTLPTRASFCMDGKKLYVSVTCGLNRGEPPLWRSDNDIPIDGAIPWGQDVVEVLLSPRDALESSGADLLTLQIKPNALLVARKGGRTDPPMNPVEPWPCNAQVAVAVRSEAWTVELAIPLAAFDSSALRRRVWGVNVTRLDSRRGEYSSWSGARGHCYSPETLGNLVLQQP